MNQEMETTKFYCEKCEKHFEIEHDKHIGLWEMATNIPRYHKQVSPDCEFDGQKVRIEE